MKKNSNLSDYVVLRRRGIELHKIGKKQQFIADVLGVSIGAVNGWIKQYGEKGEASLAYPKTGGSQRRINEKQQQELIDYLNLGAVANGYDGDLWNRPRVQHLIKEKFGIVYSIRAVGNLLKDLGYTVQKPEKRSYKQDPEKVSEWIKKRLPALKKKP